MKRYAICLGLTKLDPQEYGGWDGDCPGCDVDVHNFASLCHEKGFDGVYVALNGLADSDYLSDVFVRAACDLEDGDLLVFYFSGHGGQRYDESGDELDGQDETICLYSGELVDDDIAEYIGMVPDGVRVLMVTDSCHSGTNFRGARKPGASQPIQLVQSAERIECSLLHFGGCSDDRYSYGSEEGGEFTTRLCKVARRSDEPMSYREWFAKTFVLMPKHQVPTITAWGVSLFDDREFLT